MLNKPTSSGIGEVGDAINTPYKHESRLGVTDVKVKVHEERKQEVSPNTKDAQEAECCCSITEHSNHVNPEIRDSIRARYPVVLERSKQLELATFCVSDNGSKACHDPGLELATAGIDLLASVAISESSSNHETESTVILSRSLPALETDVVSEEGELKSFDDAKTDRKGEAIDSLPEASAESNPAARNQELVGSQYILSSSNEIEIKNGYESDEKEKIQEPSSGIQSDERTAKLEAAISESKAGLAAQKRSLSQENDSVTSLAVPFIDKSSNKNLVLPEFETSTLMVGTYSIGDGGIMDQEEKDERIADVGKATQRKEETDMREFNASRKFGKKDIEVFMQVAKDGKQSEKKGVISSKEKSNHEGTMTKETNQADSFFEHPFKALDQLESYESLGNNVNHSPSTTMLAQRYTGCTSLNDELDRKVMERIDTNKADQILGTSEKLAIEIPDNDRNWSLHQQQASSVELTSQQITEPVAPHSEPKITDQNLEIEKVTQDDHPPKCEKLDFDLNEEFGEEAFLQDNVSLHALPSSKLMLVTATRGPFIHPESSIQSKGEPGWRGSAATSAFRLANARHVVHQIHSVSEDLMPDAISFQKLKPSTQPLNFDLNVTEEQVLEDDDRSAEVSLAMNMHDRKLSCSTGLKDINVFCNITAIDKQIKWPVLDLNIIHEPEDGRNLPGTSCEAGEHRVDSKVALQTCMNSKLAFDLNGGPVIEIIDEPTPPAQNVRSIANADGSASGAKIAGNKRNVCQWSGQAKNIYCARAEYISPPIRAAGPESVYHTVTAGPSANQFHGDAYKSGTSFPSSTVSYNQNPYLHGGYTFGFNNSSCSSVSTQHMESRSSPFIAATSPVPSSVSVMPSYARTSTVGVREITRSTNEGEWTRKSLDLNAGPDAHEMTEAREDRMNGRLLYTGMTKRPYQQVIEVLEGPVEGERLKKMKEVEATAWGMQQRECLLFKQ